MKLNEVVETLAAVEVADKIVSNTPGRRNWLIRTEVSRKGELVIFYNGAYGRADDLGLLSERISYIAEHKVRWYKFTYKKDYEAALNALRAMGAKE